MAILGEGRCEVPSSVLFSERCIEHLFHFAFNTDKTIVGMVDAPIVFVKDPFIRLKRKKLGPMADLREGTEGKGSLRGCEGLGRGRGGGRDSARQKRKEGGCLSQEEVGQPWHSFYPRKG